jgi:hypothetical protein
MLLGGMRRTCVILPKPKSGILKRLFVIEGVEPSRGVVP